MGIESRAWQEEIGRGDIGDPTSWDAIDTSRTGEVALSAGRRQRGRALEYVAVYPLKDGRWCCYVSTPGTNGRGWVVSADSRVARNAARRMGQGARIGIGNALEAAAE